MKNSIKVFIGAMILCLSATTFSQSYSQDIGKINTIFVSITGDIAITLSGGFQNAITTNQCAGANSYAGVPTTADPVFKSAILAAKAAQQTVRVTISGCLAGWFKIIDVYIE